MADIPVVIRGRQPNAGLKLSSDRKVMPFGYYQTSRKRWVPGLLNSFGLLAGESCPGQTSTCASKCYALKSEQSKGVSGLVGHNLRLLEAANFVEKIRLIDEMVGRFWGDAKRQGVPERSVVFRIHWDGDFFSAEYARAWAEVIPNYPDIGFWTYTRSFTDEVNVLPYLVGIPNLSVYLSIDRDNLDTGRRRLEEYGELVRAAWFGETESVARRLSDDRPLVVCPENARTLPLVDDQGRGACVKCRLCIRGSTDIIFMAKKPRKRPRGQLVLPLRFEPAGELRECASLRCSNRFVFIRRRGQPQKYCSTQCRWDAYHDSK